MKTVIAVAICIFMPLVPQLLALWELKQQEKRDGVVPEEYFERT